MVVGTIGKVVKSVADYTGSFFDKRLEARGEQIMANMVERETVVMNQLSDNRAEYVGASRFFNNASVTSDAIIEESSQRCQIAAKGVHVLAMANDKPKHWQQHDNAQQSMQYNTKLVKFTKR
jgi:hypothetical protein